MKLCPGHERLSSDYSDWKCGAQCRFCQGTCQKCFPPEPATPTPSITVGTQVRLTGVVVSQARNGTVHVKFNDVHCEIIVNAEETHHLEVIRQPFKRGEVVWPTEGGEYDESWFLVSDEAEGKVLAVATDPEEYQHIVALDVDDYERRP